MGVSKVNYKNGTTVSIFYSLYPCSNMHVLLGGKCIYTSDQLKRELKKIGLNSGPAVRSWNYSCRAISHSVDYGFYDAR